jgi:alpha-mannosidase
MTEFRHDLSQFWLTTTIHADSARIDCHLRADWLEKGTETAAAPMLRVHFSAAGKPDRLSCDVPFAVVDRKPGMEIPAQKWVDVRAGSGAGLAVLNRGKYGHSLVDNTIRLTLLRSAYDPDIHPDIGRHEISWAIVPHEGTWKDAELPRVGMSYNVPFETFQARAQSGDLGLVHSFLSVDKSDKNFVVTGVKQAEDGVRTVVRGYDSSGRGAAANITLPFKVTEADRTNLLEEPVDEGNVTIAGNDVSLKIKPWGIATVKVG